MNYNNSPYDAIGVSIVEELFKQVEEIAPIEDEPTPKNPSLLQRFIHGLRDHNQTMVKDSGLRSRGDECASPKAI